MGGLLAVSRRVLGAGAGRWEQGQDMKRLAECVRGVTANTVRFDPGDGSGQVTTSSREGALLLLYRLLEEVDNAQQFKKEDGNLA